MITVEAGMETCVLMSFFGCRLSVLYTTSTSYVLAKHDHLGMLGCILASM